MCLACQDFHAMKNLQCQVDILLMAYPTPADVLLVVAATFRRCSHECVCATRSTQAISSSDLHMPPPARLAQSAERKALNLVVVGSSPTVGVAGAAMATARAEAKHNPCSEQHSAHSKLGV